MTNLQYGTLKYLLSHSLEVEHLGRYNLTTLGSLVQHGWLERRGNLIAVTGKGVEAYELYHRGGPNYRQHEGPISDRVRLMLHISQLRTAKAS